MSGHPEPRQTECPQCKLPHAWADPADQCEFEIGQVWARGRTRITIERLAHRSVFGPLTISGIPLVLKGQVRHSQLRSKWELIG